MDSLGYTVKAKGASTDTTAYPRREFIRQMSLLGMTSLVPFSFFSCWKDSSGIDYQGSGSAPYKVWEEMLMAVKTSPDFLQGRMETLIKNKDPKEMLAFVRDEIHLIPPDSDSLRDMGKLVMYGISGVLRSGFATPREKAELLSQMLHRAGIEAEVVYEETAFKAEETRNLFFKPFERKFEPMVNQKILDRWRNELEITLDEEKIFQIDEKEQDSKSLARQLFDFLPEKELHDLHKFNFNWDNKRTPCVKIKHENETKFAHLFDSQVPFGSLKGGSSAKTRPADPPVFTNKKVEISLTVSKGGTEEIELVKGQWPVEDLAGNQIVLKFDSGLNFFQQLTTAVGSLHTFTPVMALQSFSMNKEEMAAHSYTGKTVSLQGDLIYPEKEGVLINGIPLSAHPDKDLQKRVAALTVKAITGKYPFVKFELSPKDDQGNLVEGLSAADFSLKTDGNPLNMLLQNNRKTPKVILMYDASLSMPKSYSDENMARFIDQLESQILESYPATNIQKWATDSNLYSWLRKASASNSDLIIYATDGDQRGDFKPEWQEVYRSGAPAIILNVKNSSRPHHVTTFETMANATNGIVIPAENQEETKLKIVDYLKELDIPPYVFTSHVPEKKATYHVQFFMDDQRISAGTSFEFKLFPDDTTPLGSELSGVHLRITYNNNTVRKTLAGYDAVLHKNRVPNQSDFLDVRSLLLGGALIGVEGQGATFANRMADLLQYKLAGRDMGEALLENDVQKAREAYENGIYFYDDRLASLMQPLQDQVTGRSLTFATGPRMGIITNKIGVGMPHSTVGFDFVKTSNFVTLAADPVEAFKENMRKTAQMALIEDRMFEESTFSLLKNQDLTETRMAKNSNWFDKQFDDPVNQFFWRERIYKTKGTYKIFDKSAQTKAFWEINTSTGELYGMLSNDTAGGVERINKQLNEILRVMDTYLLLLGVMSVRSGIPLAIVGGYGKTLVKLYALASEALVVMDTTGLDEAIKATLAELACETYKTIVLGLYGNAGTVMGGLEYLIGLMTGKSLCKLN